MKKRINKSFALVLPLLLMLILVVSGCGIEEPSPLQSNENPTTAETSINQPVNEETNLDEAGHYTSKEEVSLYIHLYGKLPGNYITKNDAKDEGWVASKGNLFDVTDEKSIGGDRFYNRERLLPDEKGRKYYEADIDYTGGSRGAKRIVFSNDGLIYYTGDHYNSFELLYGEE